MTPEQLLRDARVIAVVGCSDKPWRDSHAIARYLQRAGYRVYPVNPTIESALGVRACASVADVPEHVDIVNVFRLPQYVPDVVADAIAAGAGALWLQSGITHPAAEQQAGDAGLFVVADRCIAVEHSLRIGAVA